MSIPKYGTAAYCAWQYKQRLEANKGRNFEYWSEKHEALLEKGWEIHSFKTSGIQWGRIFKEHSTSSIEHAKRAVLELRSAGNFARIVCGYEQNRQRNKMFTIIFKPKKQIPRNSPSNTPPNSKRTLSKPAKSS